MSHNNDTSSEQQKTMHDELQVEQLQEELARQIRLYQLEQLQSGILQQQMLLLTAATRRSSSKDVQHIFASDSTYIRSTTQSTPVSPSVLTHGRSHSMNISWPQSAPTNHTHNRVQFNTHSLVSTHPSRMLNGQGAPQSPVDDSPSQSILAALPTNARQGVKRTADGSKGESNGGKAATSSRKRLAHLDSRQFLTLDIGMRVASTSPKSNAGGVLRASSPVDPDMQSHASSSLLPLSPHCSHSLSIPGRTEDDPIISTSLTLHGQQNLPPGSPSSVTSNAAALPTNTGSSLTPPTPTLLTNMNKSSLNNDPAPTMPGGGENRACDISTASTGETQRLPSTTQNQPGEDSMGPVDPPAPDAAVITTMTPLSPPKPRRGTTAAPSNHSTSTQNDSGASSYPVLKVKSTQKDSEQKRRDLLKESFDELRLLLPSIDLSFSANTGPLAGLGLGEGKGEGDPPLHGAKPPRGPHRGDGETPNKGVSKLMLLQCGNEFIQDLIAQVGRRDEEVGRLREELKRLRATLGIVDLERDLNEEDKEFREERRRARKRKRDEDREQASAKQRAA